MDEERTRGIGNIIQGSGQRDHDGAHFRMDVAEDVRNTFAREPDFARAAGLIQAQIKALAVEKREYVVKERILVGKADQTADRDD